MHNRRAAAAFHSISKRNDDILIFSGLCVAGLRVAHVFHAVAATGACFVSDLAEAGEKPTSMGGHRS